MSVIKEYLEGIIKLLGDNEEPRDYYKWLLSEGNDYPRESLLVHDKIMTTKYLDYSLNERRCFDNSIVVHERLGLDYVEGFYVVDKVGIPLDHAWNHGRNQAWDFTSYKFEIPVKERFGIVVPKRVLILWKGYEFKRGTTILKFYYNNFIKQNNYELGKRETTFSRQKTDKVA